AVKGHRGDTELRRQAPEADGVEALGGPDLDRAIHDRLARQPAPSRRVRSLHCLTSIRRIPTLASMSTLYADTDNSPRGSGRSPIAAVLGSRPYVVLWTAQFASLMAGFFNYV